MSTAIWHRSWSPVCGTIAGIDRTAAADGMQSGVAPGHGSDVAPDRMDLAFGSSADRLRLGVVPCGRRQRPEPRQVFPHDWPVREGLRAVDALAIEVRVRFCPGHRTSA